MKTISLTYENVGDYGAWIVPDDEDKSKMWLPLKNRDLYMPESVIALGEDGTPAGCLMFIRLSEKEVLLD